MRSITSYHFSYTFSAEMKGLSKETNKDLFPSSLVYIVHSKKRVQHIEVQRLDGVGTHTEKSGLSSSVAWQSRNMLSNFGTIFDGVVVDGLQECECNAERDAASASGKYQSTAQRQPGVNRRS